MFLSGERLGRYIIDRRIGSGGMALTLRCRLDGIGGFQKYVVIKIMQPHLLESTDVAQMFLDEARLCAGLSHPNIPQIFEVDEEDGLPYLVMEYIPGPNLSLLKRQMEANAQRHYGHITAIGIQVARALAYAHALTDKMGQPLHIIHRDVSLPNILVSADGTVRLIDFGIAKSALSSKATESGMLKGKLAYMAPEQLVGKRIDHRVDIYQLGVCLYWMTTGSPPFVGENPVSIWNAHHENAIALPTDKINGYPQKLQDIILKALSENPDNRYQNAAEFADALDNFLQNSEWRSNARDVGAWITQLFPGDQLQAALNSTYDGGTVAPSKLNHPLPTPPTPPETPPPPPVPAPSPYSNHRIPLWGMAFVIWITVGIAWWGLSKPKAPDYASEQTHYLEASTKLLEDNKPEMAMEMLERAKTLGAVSADVDIEILKLKERAEIMVYLRDAQTQFTQGNLEAAATMARSALDRDPENALASEILTKIHEKTVKTSAATAPTVAPGELNILGTEGAYLYINDMRIGRIPLLNYKMPPGNYTIYCRLRGFIANSGSLVIESGKKSNISFNLSPNPPTLPPLLIPAPTSPSANDAPQVPAESGSKMPEKVSLHTAYEAQAMLKQIEDEALRLGVPSGTAKGVTSSLATALVETTPQPDVFILYPMQILHLIQSGHTDGLSRRAIADKLKETFYTSGITP